MRKFCLSLLRPPPAEIDPIQLSINSAIPEASIIPAAISVTMTKVVGFGDSLGQFYLLYKALISDPAGRAVLRSRE